MAYREQKLWNCKPLKELQVLHSFQPDLLFFSTNARDITIWPQFVCKNKHVSFKHFIMRYFLFICQDTLVFRFQMLFCLFRNLVWGPVLYRFVYLNVNHRHLDVYDVNEWAVYLGLVNLSILTRYNNRFKVRLHRRYQTGVFAKRYDFRVKSPHAHRKSVYTRYTYLERHRFIHSQFWNCCPVNKQTKRLTRH